MLRGQASVAGQSFVSPTISDPTITGVAGFANGTPAAPSIAFTADTDTGIYRASANRGGLSGLALAVLEWLGVASAVNFLLATNAVTTGAPSIAAVGSDTNVSLNLIPQAAGGVRVNGQWAFASAVAAKTTTTALTAAEMIGGILTANQGAGAGATYTMPTGTDLQTGLPAAFATGDTLEFSIVNISTNALEIATLAGDTGTTLVGGGAVLANSAAGVASSATFRVRKTGANAFSIYRVG